jgi:hypothetical protein
MAINPLQPPINYAGMVPQINIGQQFAELGQVLVERQKRTQAEEVKATYKTDLQSVLDNPSMKAFNDFSLKYPQQREVIKDVASRFTQEQQDSEFDVGRDVAVSLENKNPDVALNILNQAIDARKNSNLPTTVYDQIKQILSNTDDPDRIKKAQAQTNFSLTLLNPEKFGKVVESLEKQKLAPSALRESIAKADEAVIKAANAVATAPDDIAKAKAQRLLEEEKAKQEAVKAKYAEREAIDAIIKRGADLGLTKAQTTKVVVETKNLNETGKMLKLDYEAALKGVPLPSKNTGTNVGNATEDERKAAGWLSQATNAYTNMLKAMYTKEGKRTGAEIVGTSELALGKFAQTPERQNFVQAASSLSEALLRAATGAGVNKDEALQKLEELTPTYFDTDENIKQKLAAIPVYLDSLKARAGRAAPSDFKIPTKEGVIETKPFSITVGSATYNFPTQAAADTFKNSDAYKKAAGIK